MAVWRQWRRVSCWNGGSDASNAPFSCGAGVGFFPPCRACASSTGTACQRHAALSNTFIKVYLRAQLVCQQNGVRELGVWRTWTSSGNMDGIWNMCISFGARATSYMFQEDFRMSWMCPFINTHYNIITRPEGYMLKLKLLYWICFNCWPHWPSI